MTAQTLGNPAPGATAKRNVFLLSICLALSMTGTALIMTVTALTGKMLADNDSLATLPLALTFVATTVTTIPASYFMARFGRRLGFSVGQVIGVIGALAAVCSIYLGDYWLFVAGSILLGSHNAFWQYYRFAAAETAGPAFREKAISYVMAGGVFAAIAGPQIAKWTRDFLEPYTFSGGFAAIAGLNLLTMVILQFLKIPRPGSAGIRTEGRPLAEIAKQPVFIVAVLAAMIGYGAMSLVMTATPLAMEFCLLGTYDDVSIEDARDLVFADTATVIQWHALAMFAPSFLTGHLIRKFGVLAIILVGAALNILCVAVNISGFGFTDFWIGLVLLGLGWNFMFVGGTTLLTESYRPEEQSKVQACNDFLVFGMVSIASLSSGVLVDVFSAGGESGPEGWAAVNLAIAAPMVLVFMAAIWLMTRRRQPA